MGRGADVGALRTLLGTLKGGRLLVALLLAFGVALLVARVAAAAYVEILWHQTAGYEGVFWRRVAWSWGTRLVAGLIVVAVVYGNLRLAAVSLGGISIRRRFGNIEISEQLPGSYVSGAILLAASLLGLWFGAAIPFIPHVVGDMRCVGGPLTSWSAVAKHAGMLVLFGGIGLKNAQVAPGGSAAHGLRSSMQQVATAGVEVVNIGPCRDDVPDRSRVHRHRSVHA